MAEKIRFVLTVKPVGRDVAWTWVKEDETAARNLAMDVGSRGFFAATGDENESQLILPHHMASVTVTRVAICQHCDEQFEPCGERFCEECRENVICRLCQRRTRATDRYFCARCISERVCGRCGLVPKLEGLRYCKPCAKSVREELALNGYLQRVPTNDHDAEDDPLKDDDEDDFDDDDDDLP